MHLLYCHFNPNTEACIPSSCCILLQDHLTKPNFGAFVRFTRIKQLFSRVYQATLYHPQLQYKCPVHQFVPERSVYEHLAQSCVEKKQREHERKQLILLLHHQTAAKQSMPPPPYFKH